MGGAKQNGLAEIRLKIRTQESLRGLLEINGLDQFINFLYRDD